MMAPLDTGLYDHWGLSGLHWEEPVTVPAGTRMEDAIRLAVFGEGDL